MNSAIILRTTHTVDITSNYNEFVWLQMLALMVAGMHRLRWIEYAISGSYPLSIFTWLARKWSGDALLRCTVAIPY